MAGGSGPRPMKASAAASRLGRTLGMGALLLFLACDPLAPFEPEIANTPDGFQFQVTDMKAVTLRRDYAWQHSGPIANVNQATTLSAGSGILTVLDASGKEVYRRNLTDNGTFQTGPGASGTWTIRIEFVRASGTVNFRVQRQ